MNKMNNRRYNILYVKILLRMKIELIKIKGSKHS